MNLAAKFDVALSSVQASLDKIGLSEKPTKSDCNSGVDSGCHSDEIEDGNNVLSELENSYSAFNDDFEFLTMATFETPNPSGTQEPTLYENLKDYVLRPSSSKFNPDIDLESAIEISDDNGTDDTFSDKYYPQAPRDVNSDGSLLEKRDLSTRSRRRRRKKSRSKADPQLRPLLQRGVLEKKLDLKKPIVEDSKRRDQSFSSLSRSPTPRRYSGRKVTNQDPCLQTHSPSLQRKAENIVRHGLVPLDTPSMNYPNTQTQLLNHNVQQSCSPSIHFCDCNSQEYSGLCLNQVSFGNRGLATGNHQFLRPIFVDGCNISFEHGKHERYSAIGLEIMFIYFWQKYGYDNSNFTIVQRPGGYKTAEDHAILNSLFKRDLLIFTPRRHVGREVVVSDDDLFLLSMAKEKGGIVISKDQFRDVYEQTDDPEMKELIEKRILQFAFKGNEVWFPQDPLGKDGPSLDEFLKF